MTKSNERVGSGASWRAVHEKLRSLARDRAGLDFEEGRWLLAAHQAAVHRELGFGSFTEYVERLFGYAPRVTHDKLRVAAALRKLPALSDQLSEGELSYSHARELTRVATPETEKEWLAAARGRTVREVERLVAGQGPGALPGAKPDPKLERHVLRFDVSGETLASFREMVAQLRREAGEHLDDDALLLILARRVLGGPNDDGRASYQIALDTCKECQRARQMADGATIEVSRAAAEMARCDAQHVPTAHVGTPVETTSSRAAQEVPPATRRLVVRRDHHRCQVPGCEHATSSTSTISRPVPRAAATTRTTCSRYAALTTARCTKAASSSLARWRPSSTSGTPTAHPTAEGPSPRARTRRRKSLKRCDSSGSRRETQDAHSCERAKSCPVRQSGNRCCVTASPSSWSESLLPRERSWNPS